MSPLDLSILLFMVLAFLNYWVQRSVLYPPFIFSAMWLLDFVVARSGLIEINPLHGNTLLLVSASAIAFSVGGLLAGLTPQTFLRIHIFPREAVKTPDFQRKTLMIILLCALPVLFYEVYQLSRSQGGGLGILMQAREAQVEAAQNGEPIHSIVLDYFTMVATLASLLFATEKKDLRFWVVTGVAFIGCILSTGRTSLLLLISGLSAIRLLQTRRESFLNALKLLRWPIALFVALYILLIFTNKNTEGMSGGIGGIATYYVLSYIVGPLAAFDAVVQHPSDFLMTSNHTFEFPFKVASLLHLTDYTAPPKLDSFVMVPFPTNVYTVFKFYFLELGTAGTIALLFFIGLFHSLLYLKARQGGRFSTYLFAFSVYAVLMVIFDDAYYTTGIYLRACIFGGIYFLIGAVPLRLLPSIKLRRTEDRTWSY